MSRWRGIFWKAPARRTEIFEDSDMDLLDAGYLDSFSLLNIIVEIEDKLGIALQPTDIKKDNIRTVNEMIRFVTELCYKG